MKKLIASILILLTLVGCYKTTVLSNSPDTTVSTSLDLQSIQTDRNDIKIERKNLFESGWALGGNAVWLDDENILVSYVDIDSAVPVSSFSVIDKTGAVRFCNTVNMYFNPFIVLKTDSQRWQIADQMGTKIGLDGNVVSTLTAPRGEEVFSDFYDIKTETLFTYDEVSGNIFAIDNENKTLLYSPKLKPKQYIAVSRLSPDGTKLVFAQMGDFYSEKIVVVSISGEVLLELDCHFGLPAPVWFGEKLIVLDFSETDAATNFWLIEDNAQELLLSVPEADDSIYLSSGTNNYGCIDGKMPIVTISQGTDEDSNNTIQFLSLIGKSIVRTDFISGSAYHSNPMFSPNGKKLCYWSTDEKTDERYLIISTI